MTVGSVVLRFTGFAVLWVVLSNGAVRYLPYGAVLVFAVTVLSLRLSPPIRRPHRRRIEEIPALLGWYLTQMVRGGIDVARRALGRRVDVAPRIHVVDIELPAGAVRRLAMGMFNLMPGALVRRDLGERAELHELAPQLDAVGSWQELTRRLGRISGCGPVTPDPRPPAGP